MIKSLIAVLTASLAVSEPSGAISRANAEHYTWGNCCDAWYLVKNERLNVIQEHMPPGTSETAHLHRKAQQFFFVLKGQAALERAGETLVLHENEGALVEAGVPHRMQNRSGAALDFLLTSEPPSHDDRVPVP